MNDDFVAGFALIGEMTKEELIDELANDWRRELSNKDIVEIKKMVITTRLRRIQDRMIAEAGLKQTPGFLGFPTITEDDSNE